MARVESGGELLQRKLLARALWPFKKDDRAAAIGDLRQLQLAELTAQRDQLGLELIRAQAMNVCCPEPHRRNLRPVSEGDNRPKSFPQLFRPVLSRTASLSSAERP